MEPVSRKERKKWRRERKKKADKWMILRRLNGSFKTAAACYLPLILDK